MVSFRVAGDNEGMYIRLDRARRALPLAVGVVTMLGVGALLAWDVAPGLFPAGTHEFLGAFTLAGIAIAYMVYQVAHRPPPLELLKAVLLAVAFLFWAANQYWPNLAQATLFNDIAIALFVLDVFLVIVGWPAAAVDTSFGETCEECGAETRV